ncbi:MAG: SMP-30/gluconolactonase/LRE family protein [Betaproteobacteria bacterium]|nr:SMP-30/gluconolactonase/LRE family protein [Betaproteobacteria bacterium]NBT11358.1 SMP-30/gluconolactonase/LRE family protein [Betaproteobacteria bacterium]
MKWTPLPVPPSRLGESPVWHPVTRQLYWCDIPAGVLHRWDPRLQVHDQWDVGSDVACCAPVADGSLLLARRSGIVHWDPLTGAVRPVVAAPYDTAKERFNDGKVDPMGRFWVGTLYEPRQPALARVYRLEMGTVAPRLVPVADQVTVSNGLAFSPDGGTVYRSDTTSHTVWRADLSAASGEAGPWSVLASFDKRREGQPLHTYGGRPDGAAVDAEGCYWAAMFEGQRLVRLSPQGEWRQTVELPVRCPTMPCFGGDDLRTLYVTSARDHRPADELDAQPWAGCVLQARVEVPGVPAHCVLPP